jgi:hypothetical protein
MLAGMSTRKLQALIAGGLLLLGWALWLRTSTAPPVVGAVLQAVPPSVPSASELALQPTAALPAPPPEAAPVRPATPTSAAQRLTHERQQLRTRVLSSLREREQQKRAVSAPGPVPGTAPVPDDVGTMVDKTGELSAEALRVLNHELMPMVSQCLDQAHERDPRLQGMLALQIGLASVEALGSMIETVEPSPVNDLGDPELIECVRQSAFTIELPLPSSDQRTERELTIPYGIDPKQWRPRESPAENPAAPTH